MDKGPATSNSWELNPLPPEKKLFNVPLTLTAEEYQRIQSGHIPYDMDDKWFIYFEEEWLNFHRSWTGNCIYRLRFEPSASGYHVVEAWVNRNPGQYKLADDEFDSRFVQLLIDLQLLGKDIPLSDIRERSRHE